MQKSQVIDAEGNVLDEFAFQRICNNYVWRVVGSCISGLMYDIGQNLEACAKIFDFDYDEAFGWFESVDLETTVHEFIDGADLNELEYTANKVGYWEEVLADSNVPEVLELKDDGTVMYKVLDQFFDEEYEAIEAAQLSVIDKIREVVKGLITNNEEYEEIISDAGLDPELNEIYEHWTIVDTRFENQLKEQGEVVFDFGGMTIWGRSTTGQSISIDYVVRQIVKGLPDHHWVWDTEK